MNIKVQVAICREIDKFSSGHVWRMQCWETVRSVTTNYKNSYLEANVVESYRHDAVVSEYLELSA